MRSCQSRAYKKFGAGRIPIREAHILFMSENLVRVIPNSGIYVTDMSFQELKDVFVFGFI